MPHFALLSSLLLGTVPISLSATFDVVVGGPGVLKFNPSFVNANVGDVVRFTFQQKNHTASQSTFDRPCSLAPGGFDTGFIPVSDNATSFPVAELPISNANPIWVYCRQANHCQQGMVFAVNPGDKFAAFQTAATADGAPPYTAPPTSVTSSATSAATSSVAAPSSTSGTDHRVIVGGPNILAYSPSNITAQVGDTITFEFHQKNHTITASSFNTPCRALSLTSTTGDIGFDSGFMPVADAATTFPTYTIRVNDTNPIWAYCRQASHCGQGMVFSANAVESGPKNFSAYQTLAMQQNGTITTTTSDAQTAFKLSFSCGWIAVVYLISFLA
ncbi:hypothetical protein GALMADRAFT_276281 [Galerina marginata CBS 339.88]|uniref:Phytocyanin domain-containing protein n=1 Tax=Galerina marginata (strain CBS 339.88) TaxID=685588 RepID=A0A067TNN6_GALM3|nr:hypothetical protein GALMADRAFT_276281 [Galerina marginata CBS 339.88]